MPKAVKKTRKQWAVYIRACHLSTVKQTVQGILKIGRTLIAAKAALDQHGEFEKMIERDLPFKASTAQRLMKIARDPRLRKAAHGQGLPVAWRTLYELTMLPDAQFEQAVTTGAIRPSMTRGDAVAMRPSYNPRPRREPEIDLLRHKADRDLHPSPEPEIVALHARRDTPPPPVQIVADDRQVPPVETITTWASVTIHEIERLADRLQAEIERGEVVFNIDFELCTGRIITKLSGMRRH